MFGMCLASLGAFGGFHVARLLMTLFRSAPQGPTPYPGLAIGIGSFLVGAPLGAIVGLTAGIWLVRIRVRQGKPNGPTWIGMLVGAAAGFAFLVILMSSPALTGSADKFRDASDSVPMPRWVAGYLRFHRELGNFFLPAYLTAWGGLGGLLAAIGGFFDSATPGRLDKAEPAETCSEPPESGP